MLVLQIRRIASSAARRLGYGRRPESFSGGLPQSLDREVWDRVVTEFAGESPGAVQYAALATSGRFFEARTFRVRAALPSGTRWSAIYKAVDLSPDQGTGFRQRVAQRLSNRVDSIPLLVWGGSADRTTHPRRASFAHYLPDVYHVAQSASGFEYQVIQEDLSPSQGVTKATVGAVIGQLADVHNALAGFIDTYGRAQFTIDATAYEQAVEECTVEAIRDYASTHGSRRAAAVESQVGPITHCRSSLLERVPWRPIHGDLTASNVLVDPSLTSFKVIDWERTTIGFPHQDLAALVRNMPAADQRRAERRFAESVTEVSPADHTKAYMLSKRVQKLKAAAIWCVRLEQDEFDADERSRSRRRLQARIERNLADVEILGTQLLEQSTQW